MTKTIHTDKVLEALGMNSREARIAQHLLKSHLRRLSVWISQSKMSHTNPDYQCNHLANCIEDLGRNLLQDSIDSAIYQAYKAPYNENEAYCIPIITRIQTGILEALIRDWDLVDYQIIADSILNAMFED